MGHNNAFAFYEELLLSAPRKAIRVVGSQGPPIIAYSDAFFRPYSEPAPPDGLRCRLGWVLFDPLSDAPYGGTMPLSEDILCRWVKRDQQVFVAETLAPLAASIHHADRLRNRDIVWFVDNVGACSVLIKGNSSQHDAGIVTATAHLCWETWCSHMGGVDC